MKIIVFEIEDWQKPVFSVLARDHQLHYQSEALTQENADRFSDADIISTFVHSRINDEVLDRFSGLKLITTRSTGFDHIDLHYCSDKGITVCNVPNYGDVTVAEHTFGLLLMVSRRLCQAAARTRQGSFDTEGLQGFDLCEKTLGVIGTGNIGGRMIEMARGFRMKVLATDIAPDQELSRRLQFDYLPLPELLSRSDIVSLHIPGSPDASKLISKKAFSLMREGAVLINTARGSIVDSIALIEALNSGKLRAAALDVLPHEALLRNPSAMAKALADPGFDRESLQADQTLMQMPNVMVTPHNAFNTREAVRSLLEMSRQNISAWLAGKPVNTIRTD